MRWLRHLRLRLRVRCGSSLNTPKRRMPARPWHQHEHLSMQPLQSTLESCTSVVEPNELRRTSIRQPPEKSDGMFYLPAGNVIRSPKFVLWRRQDLTMYTIVCYPDENRFLAGQFLRDLPRLLSEQFKVPSVSANPRDVRIPLSPLFSQQLTAGSSFSANQTISLLFCINFFRVVRSSSSVMITRNK